MALLAIFKVNSANVTVKAVLVAVASVVGLALLLNCRTWWQVADSVLRSQRRRLHGAANSMHKLKSEGFMKVYKICKCTCDAYRWYKICKLRLRWFYIQCPRNVFDHCIF